MDRCEEGHTAMHIGRRQLLAVLGGAAAWPLAAGAQQGERVRRIGVLVPYDENDPVTKPLVAAFTQALAGLGWTDGRNVLMDVRGGRADANRMLAIAQELVGSQPDVQPWFRRLVRSPSHRDILRLRLPARAHDQPPELS